MFQLTIESQELFDEEHNRFIITDACTLQLEHSLLSLSAWESKWEIPFLSERQLTPEQQIDYIRCMTLNQVPNDVYLAINNSQIEEVFKYIQRKMTATIINNRQPPKRSNKSVTAELIYYWMAALQIPFDPCERWHLNRLMTLIEVASLESQPPKKMSQRAIMAENDRLNRARRHKRHSKG